MGYWERPSVPRRARAVSVEGLAAVTADLLDDGGINRVTARAVAARLGTAPASIYSRISTVDDLLDLALDHTLAADPSMTKALQSDSPIELMLTWYDHLVQHPWATTVLGARPPRGPTYLHLSDRLCVLLAKSPASSPLALAYALSNFVLGCASTAQAAMAEPDTSIDAELAPTYAALEALNRLTPEQIVRSGIVALTRSDPSEFKP